MAGVPIYAVSSDNSQQTTSYKNIVAQYPDMSPALDTIAFTFSTGLNKNMSFTGVHSMELKADTVVNQDMAGIMTWDMFSDIPYNNPLCLQRAINALVNANTDTIITAPISQVLISIPSTASPSDVKPALIVYPNPARTIIHVLAPKGTKSISLISSDGIKRYHQDKITLTETVQSINISSFPAGTYILEVSLDNEQTLTSKIVIR